MFASKPPAGAALPPALAPLTPEVQHGFATGFGTAFFSQQRAFGPCTFGFTYVNATHRPSRMHASLQRCGFGSGRSKFAKSEPGRSTLCSMPWCSPRGGSARSVPCGGGGGGGVARQAVGGGGELFCGGGGCDSAGGCPYVASA